MNKKRTAAVVAAVVLGRSVVGHATQSDEPPHTHNDVEVGSQFYLFAKATPAGYFGERRAVPFIPNGWEEAANEAIQAQYRRMRSCAALFTQNVFPSVP
jgi:hypothetical protein